MPEIKSAQCHCGAVTFNVTLLDGFNTVRRCNCSFCRMRCAVVAFASEINITQGEDKLTEYRFNSKSISAPSAGFTPFISPALIRSSVPSTWPASTASRRLISRR